MISTPRAATTLIIIIRDLTTSKQNRLLRLDDHNGKKIKVDQKSLVFKVSEASFENILYSVKYARPPAVARSARKKHKNEVRQVRKVREAREVSEARKVREVCEVREVSVVR